MTKGRHARRRAIKRNRQIRSAVAGFGVVAICMIGVVTVATHHDDSGTTSVEPSDPSDPLRPTSTAISTLRVSTTNAGSEPDGATSTSDPTATSTSLARTVSSTVLRGKVVVIDPGHNGGNSSHSAEINRQVPMAEGRTKECDTSGTQTNDGYPEHAFTFDVASQAAADLRAKGATVYLTRDTDNGVGPCVDERAASGGAHDADVAISIHGDGGPASGRGFHVLRPAGCSGCHNEIVQSSSTFASILRDTYLSQTSMPVSDYLGSDGIMPRTDLAGINLSTVPKVFIECGNMRNATDAEMMKSASYRRKAALAIANGITLYLASS